MYIDLARCNIGDQCVIHVMIANHIFLLAPSFILLNIWIYGICCSSKLKQCASFQRDVVYYITFSKYS